jgi:hypothetical protein
MVSLEVGTAELVSGLNVESRPMEGYPGCESAALQVRGTFARRYISLAMIPVFLHQHKYVATQLRCSNFRRDQGT